MRKEMNAFLLIAYLFAIVVSGGCNNMQRQDLSEHDSLQTVASGTASSVDNTNQRADELNTLGNTAGNLTNGGYAAVQGEWAYYSFPYDSLSGLFRMKPDGTDKQKLSNDKAYSINVVGDWIYYINADDNQIYAIGTDGDGKRSVCQDRTYNFSVVGDDIYYTNANYHYSEYVGLPVYTIRTDGTDQKELCSDKVISMNVSSDRIYYINTDDDGKIYSIDFDGDNRRRLSHSFIGWHIAVLGDRIFYSGSNGYMYSISTDGGSEQMVCSDIVSFINGDGEFVYYSTRDGLFRIKPDGTEKHQLSSNERGFGLMQLVGNRIMYFDYDDGLFYSIGIDGADRKLIELD